MSALNGFRGAAEARPSWRNLRWVHAFYAPEVETAISQMMRAEENLKRKQRLRKELPEVLEQIRLGNFDEALRLDPTSAETHLRRGLAQRDAGHFDMAVRDLERALQLEPRNFTACEALDPLLARRGQFDRMIGHWSGLLQLDPKNGRAFYYRAQNHARKGDLPASSADAERACSLGVQEACRMK
jgi:tetratricopeptide (TPR) repeat protein